MNVTLIPCGEPVNESEVIAIDRVRRELQNIKPARSWDTSDEWVVLSNLAFSVTNQFQADDIDLIVLGPSGVRVIEVKHWSPGWVDGHRDQVDHEADKLTRKARRVGTTLRRVVGDLPRVDGAFLLTQQPSKTRKLVERGAIRGVSVNTLNQWKEAIGFDGPRVLTPALVRSLAKTLEPKSMVRLDGAIRSLAGYVNLEQHTAKDQRFHRVYRGSHPTRRDRVILHLYDLSASDDSKAEAKARREFETLQRLQIFPWAPRILDSFQDAPGYAGEMFFFTIVDPAAPSLTDRVADVNWNSAARVMFARASIRALAEFHNHRDAESSLVHRNLTPQTILVRYDNTPIFTGFDRTRISSDISVASSSLPQGSTTSWIAPEIQTQGLGAADQRSDIFSICASVSGLFANSDDDLSTGAGAILSKGCAVSPEQRTNLCELERALSELLGDSVPTPPAPPARYWTEEQTVRFNHRNYRIVSRLGSGGVGTTFKVIELDRSTEEELGTYVAKVVHDGNTGRSVLRSYSLARSHLGRYDGLSPIFEVAREWQENEFISLLGWIDGTPLSEFAGIFSLLAEDQDEPSSDALALRWLRTLCDALGVLHRNGLTHGDVSPRNMIVSGSSLVLTDYDFVTRVGDVPTAPGTILYCSSQRQQKFPASGADDLFALAASFFHIVFEQEPFRFGGELAKDRGLNWDGVERCEHRLLAEVLDRATTPDRSQRFVSASEMSRAIADALEQMQASRETTTTEQRSGETLLESNERTKGPDTSLIPMAHRPTPVEEAAVQSEQRVDWLRSLLQSYPGSRWGNRETRGLDTPFASGTYVPTALEESLLHEIRGGSVRLVILCGNAGDGKTALLQHLAIELGLAAR